MTAVLATANNLQAGTRETGNVTNTYGGYFTSNGSAGSVTLPWQADKFEWWRYTGYGTTGKIVSGVWFRDFPAGANLETQVIVDNGVTGNANTILETTNGITIANTASGFTNEHVTISGITAATPGVVTANGHGLVNGNRVYITGVVGTIGPSVNNQEFVVQGVTTNTFQLYDIFGNPITTTGTYTSGGVVTKEGPKLAIQASPAVYTLTLGTSVMGSNNDVVYFVAYKFNAYQNLGTI